MSALSSVPEREDRATSIPMAPPCPAGEAARLDIAGPTGSAPHANGMGNSAGYFQNSHARQPRAQDMNAPPDSELAPASANATQGVVVQAEVAATGVAATGVAERRLRELNEIGLALSSQRDIQRLLDLILTKSRELTGADAGSLFLIRRDAPAATNTPGANTSGVEAAGEEERGTLYFHLAQNDSIELHTQNVTFAVGPSTLAGYVALTGQTLCFEDVYKLSPDAPYKFNASFDKEHGYRAKSILVLPLKNHAGEVIGVLQLINRKRNREVRLCDEATVEREVVPFGDALIDLARSLASQAAVALENNLLLAEVSNLLSEISRLFDAFVLASADAIESRDPSTSGHSKRVTILTIAMAQAISEASEGHFAGYEFSPQQLKELRYAALLHDFGKIGVRERVLLKSHKIEPEAFQTVINRLMMLRRSRETHFARRQLDAALLRDISREAAASRVSILEDELQSELREIDEAAALLRRANEPESRLSEAEHRQQDEAIARIGAWRYENEHGESCALLRPEELHALRVRRGSLTPEEYREIQRHASNSYAFLKQIPWTDDLRQVPDIAHCHHEKLNGSGYPRGIVAEQIPLQARILAIADIYDALTASERPYKRAMSHEAAIAILRLEAASGALDTDVLEIFEQRDIHRCTEGWHSSAFSGEDEDEAPGPTNAEAPTP